METNIAGAKLGSKWSGLNARLLADIFAVDGRGDAVPGGAIVRAPFTDGNLEITANWQSPFEHSGAESRMPSITGMLQSGTLQSYAQDMPGVGSGDGIASRLAADVTNFSKDAQGRSGMTKMNSTQIFSGAAPIKIPLTLHFRAFDDPETEVQAPIDQLARWALARELAPNGAIVSAIEAFKGGQGYLKAMLPSLAPQMIGLRMAGYLFAPCVIESVSHSISGPRASDGSMLSVAVQVVLTTLTALDQADWQRARSGRPTKLFNN